jgi:hypothetical protein
MRNFLLSSVFEDLNVFRFEIGHKFSIFISDHGVDLHEVRGDPNYILVFRLLLRWYRRGRGLLRERKELRAQNNY